MCSLPNKVFPTIQPKSKTPFSLPPAVVKLSKKVILQLKIPFCPHEQYPFSLLPLVTINVYSEHASNGQRKKKVKSTGYFNTIVQQTSSDTTW